MSRSTELSYSQVKNVLLGLTRASVLKQKGPRGFLSCMVLLSQTVDSMSLRRTQAVTW